MHSFSAVAAKQRKVILSKRDAPDADLLKKARDLGKKLFRGESGPESEDGLFTFLGDRLRKWQRDLEGFAALARTGKYPGKDDIDHALATLKGHVDERNSTRWCWAR